MRDYSSFQDMELIAFLKADDEKALNELYNRYWDKLLAVSINRLPNIEVAEEIVQDIFVKLWQRRHELEVTGTLSTYLAVAVKYQIINQLDKSYHKKSYTELTEEHLTSHSPSVDELIFEKELLKRIEENIKALPYKCQIIFRMSRESDLTYKQIATNLEISEKTVEAHISKALKQLRTNIGLCLAAAFSFLFL